MDAKKAKRGDREAFIRLIRQMEGSLYRIARAILKNDEDAADSIQETILLAYQSVEKLRNPNHFKTWVIRILINQCKKTLKKRKNVFTLTPANEPHSEHSMELLALREAIDQLEEELKVVLILHYFEDWPLKDIAEALKIPVGTVKSRLHRARQSLHTVWKSSERVMTP